MSEIRSNDQRPEPQDGSIGRSFFGIVAKLVPAMVAAIYLYGFLVLTSHLGKFGITTTGILDASYFVAGATFVYLVAIWGIFLLRPVRALTPWIDKMSRHPETTPIGSIGYLLYQIVEVCVHLCLATFTFSLVLVDSTLPASSWAIPTLVLLIVFSGYLTGQMGNRPLHYILISLSRIVIIVFFFSSIATPDILLILGILGGLSALFNYVGQEFQKRRNSPEQQVYLVGFCAIMLTTIAVLFGSVVYGKIKRSYGGGAHVSVAVSINQAEVRSDEFIDGPTIMADVVHVSDADLYLVLADSQHLVLSRSAVLWIRLLDPDS